MIPAKEIDGELWIRAADARIKEAAELRLQIDLRDYFAANVLQGFAARDVFDPGIATPEQRAKLAYIDADAMLKEREK